MGVVCLFRGQFLCLLSEESIIGVQNDAVLGHNLRVQVIVILDLGLFVSRRLVLFGSFVAEYLL
jgi:hypothetical protein